MKTKWKKLLVILSAAILLAVNIKSFADEAESRRFSVISVSGTEAFLTRGSGEVKAAAGMPVGQGNNLRTGAKTKIYMETDDSKTIRLDSNSEAEVTQSSAKLLKITLTKGSLFFNVEKPLKEDEELTFDAAQTSMSIRGTSGIVRITEEELVFHLTEGNVTWDLGDQTITVTAGQKVTLKAVPERDIYVLQTMENFTWEDLPLFELESILEQKDNLDLTAIGLGDLAQIEQASAKLVNLQAQESDATSTEDTGNPRIIKVNVPDTKTKRNRGRSAVNSSGTQSTSTSTEPTSTEPTSTEPTSTEPTSTEPTSTEPTSTEPTSTEPTSTEPTSTEPTSTEPTSTEPTSTEPTSTEPTSTEPTSTEPTSTEPTSTEPPSTEPPSTEPTSTEPPSTEPPSTEPSIEDTTVPSATESPADSSSDNNSGDDSSSGSSSSNNPEPPIGEENSSGSSSGSDTQSSGGNTTEETSYSTEPSLNTDDYTNSGSAQNVLIPTP